MHKELIKQYAKKAKDDEDYWWQSHSDAQDAKDINDFGWLWISYKEIRKKLEEMAA